MVCGFSGAPSYILSVCSDRLTDAVYVFCAQLFVEGKHRDLRNQSATVLKERAVSKKCLQSCQPDLAFELKAPDTEPSPKRKTI